MSAPNVKCLIHAVFCSGMLCLAALPAAAATDYAMRMPHAARSTMLDIDAAGDRLVAVGQRGIIIYSDDRGQTWTQAEVPTSVMLTRVHFASPEKGWAVGHDGNVLSTSDGGTHWVMQRDGVSAQAEINEQNAGRARERVASLREQIPLAPDEDREALLEALEEAEWTLDKALEKLDEPVYAPPLMDVWFKNQDQGWASGAYGTLIYTGNGGRDWQDWSWKVDANPEELHYNGIDGTPAGCLYLASEWGRIFRSSCSGESWEALETGYDGSFFGVVVNPATDSVFAYGLLGTIYRSTDRGETWEELESQARASLFGAVAADDGTLIFVGQGGQATITTDDGESFEPLPQSSRAGLHGIAPLGGGRFAVAGDGGARQLEMGRVQQ
jgi:photosystem II stability/assembly factor-like uncharacterized protein